MLNYITLQFFSIDEIKKTNFRINVLDNNNDNEIILMKNNKKVLRIKRLMLYIQKI